MGYDQIYNKDIKPNDNTVSDIIVERNSVEIYYWLGRIIYYFYTKIYDEIIIDGEEDHFYYILGWTYLHGSESIE